MILSAITITCSGDQVEPYAAVFRRGFAAALTAVATALHIEATKLLPAEAPAAQGRLAKLRSCR